MYIAILIEVGAERDALFNEVTQRMGRIYCFLSTEWPRGARAANQAQPRNGSLLSHFKLGSVEPAVKTIGWKTRQQSRLYHCIGIPTLPLLTASTDKSNGEINIEDRLTVVKHIARKLASSLPIAAHDYANVFIKSRRLISSCADVDFGKSRVLVIGCGYNYPDVFLWSGTASEAVGVDVTGAYWRTGFSSLVRELRRNGLSRGQAAARAFLRRASYRGYFDHLRRLSGFNEIDDRQDLITYDGKNLPFSDEVFDITCSNAVLEHVLDLDALSAEIGRVTRPGGVCYHLWHNYYSFSGAHVPDSICEANPWGHLRGDPRVDHWLRISNTQLNRKMPDEICHALSEYFEEAGFYRLDRYHNVEGEDGGFATEAEHLLSRQLELELAQYPRDVLLTRAYSFLGVKRDKLQKTHHLQTESP